jgi:hypothetical protein
MPPGEKRKFKLGMSREKLATMIPGIDAGLVEGLSKYFDEYFEHADTPLYIFLKPDLEKYAQMFSKPEKEVYGALAYLASFRRDVIQLKKILVREEKNLFYVLQDEDVEQLKNKNELHDPEDPRIVYRDAEKIVRHAFVLDPVGEVLC